MCSSDNIRQFDCYNDLNLYPKCMKCKLQILSLPGINTNRRKTAQNMCIDSVGKFNFIYSSTLYSCAWTAPVEQIEKDLKISMKAENRGRSAGGYSVHVPFISAYNYVLLKRLRNSACVFIQLWNLF